MYQQLINDLKKLPFKQSGIQSQFIFEIGRFIEDHEMRSIEAIIKNYSGIGYRISINERHYLTVEIFISNVNELT